MGFIDDVKVKVRSWLGFDEILDEALQRRYNRNAMLRNYYRGAQRSQLAVRQGQADDNLVLNFIGLVVERGISMLLGEGIEFDMGGDEEEDQRQDYIDEIWRANKKDILLHKVAQYGGTLGTCFLKALPDGVPGRDDSNVLLPRLVPLDPLLMEIVTAQEDIDQVLMYVMRYNIIDPNGEEIARKEETVQNFVAIEEPGEDGPQIVGFENQGWTINNYQAGTNGNWELMSSEIWDYEFPPIIHWQNLPLAGSAYGMSDVENVIDLQDRINFIASNISKIIRYHAHPRTYGIGVQEGDTASWGADETKFFPGLKSDIELGSLEMNSDLAESRSFLLGLRQSLFDITRTVDITSLADKLGALTNFGLRVLFYDSIAKLNTKKELYGEALVELNHRLMVLGDVSPSDGGEVVWPETIPTDEREEVTGLQFDLDVGLVSKQTAAAERGYEWKTEQERIDEEKVEGDNIGAAILRAFEQGQ